MMSCYGFISEIVFSLARPYLYHKYSEGNEQRYGHFANDIARDALWVHAVSVGEVQSAAPFIKQLKTSLPERPVLLSTITETGKKMASQLVGDLAQHIYYPWDAPSIVKRTLNTLHPTVYFAFEREIWPELLNQLNKRDIPAFLVNGRLSESTYKKLSRCPKFWSKVYNAFKLVLTRSDIERDRFIGLGVEPQKVLVTGDCKVDALIERKNSCDVSEVKRFLPDDAPVILAGSTHEGEEPIVLEAFSVLRKQFANLRLVIVPRHPERAFAIQTEAVNVGLNAVLLSTCTMYDWQVLVVDRIGMLFQLYGCVKAAFIGGSIALKGGQNIMEPAIWGIPFCQGPDYRDFTEATERLTSAGLCSIVHDAKEMRVFFETILTENDKDRYQEGSRKFFAQLGGASRRSWEYIQHVLEFSATRSNE